MVGGHAVVRKSVLHAQQPAADCASQLGLYFFLIRSWTTRILTHDDGRTHEGAGGFHARRVLEGRAIQDVWMIPGRAQRTATRRPLPVAGNWYGNDAARLRPRVSAPGASSGPTGDQQFVRQIGRADGNDIVQDGEHVNGTAMRWRFTKITPASFHWIGEFMRDESVRWELQVEVFAERA